MRQPGAVALAAACLLLGALGGCGGDAGASDGGKTGDERVHVVAAFYPFAFVAADVGGDDVEVANLTEPGAEPHDLELTPGQVGEIAEADLVVYERGFQPAVDEAVEQNAADRALDVSEVVAIDGPLQDDPHLWLDPTKLASVVAAVAERLAEIDPNGADGYRQRAADLAAELEELDQEFKVGLADCRITTMVVSHEAFGHLAQRYGLRQQGIAGLSPEAEPSPARIAEVQDIVAAEGVTTIYFETLVSPDAATSLARDTGVQTAVLDPLEGLADPAAGDYFTVMRTNLETLRSGQGCT
jgi:zinc transport system substrate-binding protein